MERDGLVESSWTRIPSRDTHKILRIIRPILFLTWVFIAVQVVIDVDLDLDLELAVHFIAANIPVDVNKVSFSMRRHSRFRLNWENPFWTPFADPDPAGGGWGKKKLQPPRLPPFLPPYYGRPGGPFGGPEMGPPAKRPRLDPGPPLRRPPIIIPVGPGPAIGRPDPGEGEPDDPVIVIPDLPDIDDDDDPDREITVRFVDDAR